jgi:hypothetical protein
MDRVEHLLLTEAARLESVTPKALARRLERKRIFLPTDPEDTRRKLVPVSALSRSAYEAWSKAQICTALQGINGQAPETPSAENPGQAIERLQPALLFAPTSPSDAARDAVVAAIPQKQRAYVDRWLAEIAENINGTWKIYRGTLYAGRMIVNGHDFICARAALHNVSVSNYYAKLKLARQVLTDPTVPKPQKWTVIAESLVSKPRPGRSGHSYFADPSEKVAWQFPALRNFYLNQARFSVKAAHRMLLDLIEKKQRAWGLGLLYPRPTLAQCRTALAKIPLPDRTLGREGEEAYRNKCSPYIKRRPPDHSGDFCVTDQKVFDILCRDSAWRLGRIWTVNFLDVASWRRLGGAYGPALSGDMVMEAAAHMLSGACVPGHVHMDLGKEFIGKRFNGGEFRISGERLFAEAVGLWRRLGVEPIKAIGGNPQTKIIERWHGCIREFEQMFVTYTGRNAQERPPRLALLEKQARDFKEGKAPPPPIPTIEQVVAAFEWWCAEGWNAGHRSKGRYLQSMTPDEVWNVKRPTAGFRTLTESELEYYTADRRFVKIGRGGQVSLSLYGQTIEYVAPELFLHQGQEAEVLVSRRALNQVTVIYPVVGGTESCIARLKDELPWGSESRPEVKVRLRCINSVKGILKRSLRTVDAAEGVLAEAPFLPTRALLDTLAAQQIVNPRQLFGTSAPAPPPLGHPETSSTEFVGERLGLRKAGRQLTSEEVAEKAWEAMEESS